MVRRRLLQLLPILAVLAVGVGVAWSLVQTRPEPEQAPREDRGALVEVTRARAGDWPRTVRAQGTVLPSQQAGLIQSPQGRF
jgi:multidrug efflux pump subunit AcrA (membrane-fusion protein)